jgi:hypothetical protein
MAMPESEFLVDTNVAVEAIYDQFALDELSVGGRDEVVNEGTRPARVKVYDGFDKREYEYDGVRVSIGIPFTGFRGLWSYTPSTFSSTGPYLNAQLRQNDFLFTLDGQQPPSPEQILGALDSVIGDLRQTAGWINGDVRIWLPGLRTLLETTARERKERLGGISALDAALGLPIRAAASERQIPIPVQRKPLRPSPAPRTTGPEKTPERRFLPDDVYQDVLRTIEQMSHAMERTPTAAKLGEEELRNLILIVLNANYEGNVRGEVFNGVGKTDLLLTWEGDNAFIGECKVWDGQAKFREAIDQLLRYVTWRDTKAALIVFIKSGNQTDILRKARSEIDSHASRVRLKSEVSDTRFDYLLRSPSDPERQIDLALIGVVIPQA